MKRFVLVLSLLGAGCSSILGFNDPQRRDDGGVMTVDARGQDASSDDASPDASIDTDAGVDGPLSASGGFTETTQGGPLSFTGSLSLQTTCAANGVCATGGFVQ